MVPLISPSSPISVPHQISRRQGLRLLISALGCVAFQRTTTLNAASPQLLLPTSNNSILKPGAEASYFVGTAGKSWHSGQFGCVRSNGFQMHEGIDIRCVRRDANGEPNDPIMASANGTVSYISRSPGLSNYGIYLILRHQFEEISFYTLYAHLREVRNKLRVGETVRAGDPIGVMGRTSNTRQKISKDRAHLHFEINFLLNERFDEWNRKNNPGQRNDHGAFNGQNLVGIDPSIVFRQQASMGSRFSFLDHLRNQTELCRVLVRRTQFSWLKRYVPLVRRNPLADREGFAGFEVALNYNGVPYQLIPRATSEIRTISDGSVVSVNTQELAARGCRQLLKKSKFGHELSAKGQRLISLLTFS